MVGYLLDKEVNIIRKVDLNMDEQRKYEVIKKLVDTNGNKDRAALTLGISKRQVNRLIAAYRERGKAAFIHGNRGRKPVITYLTKAGNERNAYEAVRKELNAGHQAYFVYPAIEGNMDSNDGEFGTDSFGKQ